MSPVCATTCSCPPSSGPKIQETVDSTPEGGPEPEIGLHVLYHATANVPVPLLVGFLRRPERELLPQVHHGRGARPDQGREGDDRFGEHHRPRDRAGGPGRPHPTARHRPSRRRQDHRDPARQGSSPKPPSRTEPSKAPSTSTASSATASRPTPSRPSPHSGYARSEARRWVDDALTEDRDIATVEELTLAVLRARGA